MPSTKKSLKKHFKKKNNPSSQKAGSSASVEKAILETLGYRSVFNYPMSFYQLSTYLICKRKVKAETLKTSLKKLQNDNKIKVKDGKYYLADNKIILWDKRYKNSNNLMKRAEVVAEILSKIPWIKFIGVTGSVAAYNGIKNDDIDFFIIAKAQRLWLTRGFVFLILKALGLLRTEKNSSKKICPNIFVDETNLAWSKKNRNIYVAHEIVMIHPLVDTDQTFFKFLKKNEWAFNYFGNMRISEATVKSKKINKNPVLASLENWAYQSQLSYMKDKRTKEITNKNIIHFNKVDNTANILDNFEKIKSDVRVK